MKIVLAYSGGLDTSVILRWLIEQYQAEVIAYCANLGQEEELIGLEEKARKLGASKCIVEDLTEEFVRDYIYPMLRAGAIYENQYLLGTSIARPLIAKKQVEVARKEGADSLAHGATGKGNDQVRFELAYAALAPEFKVISPWREWGFQGREDLIAYARKQGIEVPVSREKPYSMDRNILHISYESGVLEDPWQEPPQDLFRLTKSPEEAPNIPEVVELEFEEGNCVGVNGEKKSPVEILKSLNRLGAKHGIGRIDIVENRFVGIKSRGVYECPGGTILYFGHRQMETITLDREVMHLRDSLIPKYAELIYNGFWFSPERYFLQAAFDQSQRFVTGTVRLKLFKGQLYTLGRKSPYSLYNPKLATMEADQGAYDPKDATGFIKLQSLRLRTAAQSYKGLFGLGRSHS
ncbi:argininosuccinate synthase [Candidatus Methylacidiphilum fumarolicum]|uniref:Argininosuccinate synthase n=2 Tax=Candidatus Methylacidiphilum fumarolicum TaxID=591154 RepID=I0JXD9_METFB|nr:argininosuccinate synthase [Candidatus Methylacidiphilum fumarolicum]MBW6415313.1 argininosuccinate synthase [Candidatus Methylacidiphilum fumarolicum]TFE69291.1 argininosuccinate synthase [Candidatus Methylacidiphilum fumarolicum]TFE72186.1 argininosuccinate synthase [Candidatus Methylacidiphilum fumarolicum]TFE72327.1 argininosuccinate synthase [Candidatus Methylacidiphilum fumarolicum]TFE77017.1 argininosuccinate synthase [Candidatus Methylacidiphilum fumarolicum]